MRLTFEQTKSVNEVKDVENPKDERAPVQRLDMPRFTLQIAEPAATFPRQFASGRIQTVGRI